MAARSSAEVEFIAMTLIICELMSMKHVIENLKIQCKGAMKLFCDNKSTISIAHNHLKHDKTNTMGLTDITSKIHIKDS